MEYPDASSVSLCPPLLYTALTLGSIGMENKRIGLDLGTLDVEEYSRLKSLMPEAEFVDFRLERGKRQRRVREA